jgi:hypothetical protein
MFDQMIFENNTFGREHEGIDYILDPESDRVYFKVIGGVCPPSQVSPGYIVIAGLQHPAGGQVPHVWLIAEKAYPKMEDLLLAMSRAHHHYKVSTHYARFKRSKQDDRVYDDFLRHVQRFNLEAVRQKRIHIVINDAPWTNERGHLKFILEKMRDELRIGNRTIYWNEPSPPSTRNLTGVAEWENTKDENTMLGALCYAVSGLLVDRPYMDSQGRMQTSSGVQKTVGTFSPTHGLDRMLADRRSR